MELMNYAIDTKKQVEGSWVMLSPGTEFLLGRMNSEHWFMTLDRIRDPHIKQLPRGVALPEEKGAELFNEALVECILLGWRGKFTLNGKEMPEYSKELALRILNTKELAPFRAMIVEQSAMLNNFALDDFEYLEGNLLSSSGSTPQ
jgi:hypothetical protein